MTIIIMEKSGENIDELIDTKRKKKFWFMYTPTLTPGCCKNIIPLSHV